MEKEQVTFAVQASGLNGPVGQPIMMVSLVVDGGVQRLVWFRSRGGQLQEMFRSDLPHGPLRSAQYELLTSVGADEIGAALFYHVGVQTDLGVLTDP